MVVGRGKGAYYALTNRHVAECTSTVAALSSATVGGGEEPATVVWRAPAAIDAVLLRVGVHDEPPVPAVLHAVAPPRVGDAVFAVGNPLGYEATYTAGVLSAMRAATYGPHPLRVFQVQASVNPGNSGGGLYDAGGHLVGLNELDLVIIPVLNKIDLPSSHAEEVASDLSNLLGISINQMISVSAKLGTNVDKVLEAIIERIPPPKGKREEPLQALVFDSHYDSYKGVIAYVRIFEGFSQQTDSLKIMSNKIDFKPIEIGIFNPVMSPVQFLEPGDVGYIATGLKQFENAEWGTRSRLLEILPRYLCMGINFQNQWCLPACIPLREKHTMI